MPENIQQYQDRLHNLRKEIAKTGLDGFILPRTDEFQGEFLAPYAQRLAWLTGFTGSAGVAVILPEKATVLSDGRYTLQLRQQVDTGAYDTGNSIETPPERWLEVHADAGMHIGYDPWLHTPRQLKTMRAVLEAKGIELHALAQNPVDTIWSEKPERPQAMVRKFPDKIAGKTSLEKRELICKQMKEEGADALILTACDSICWLLNVRGGDVDYTPLVQSFLLMHADGRLDWFIDMEKVSDSVLKALGVGTVLYPYSMIDEVLPGLHGRTVWLDSTSSAAAFEDLLSTANILDKKDPCAVPKSKKTAQEQAAIRDAHIHDGRAMVRFLAWLDEEAPKGELDELSVEVQLESFRAEEMSYNGPSFPTICGFAENGAIIHYRATRQTNKKITGDGLLLIDSGGQYEWGTTDITRTIAIGAPTQEMKENYTRVLKGHIAVSMARFPQGTTGAQIDTLARAPLWEVGLDYAHGTGHGVGCYLGVHEEAANISPRGQKALEPGMLLSNEPGYYKAGHYGIRIENLVLVKEDGFCEDTNKPMLCFETVTYAPYEERLILKEMLSAQEKKWLHDYNEKLRMYVHG